jgi:processed acidic surface protein
MLYKKSLLIYLLSFLLVSNISSVSAAPPPNELNQYLAEIGWTKQELIEYLNYYEIPLDNFNTVTELKNMLGTPINSNNLQQLLTKYSLTQKELEDLLDHFGDSLSEYKFIEDLDTSVGFYTNHDDFMAEIESELAKVGITEQEVEKFFGYLAQVEENNKAQLDQLDSIDAQMGKFADAKNPAELTNDDINELAQIVTEAIDLYEIQVKLKMNNKNISLNELLKMKEAPGNLYTAIYSKAGELLIDFTIPAEIFQGVINGWDEMLHLGELSNEFVDYLHEAKNPRYK